jgi:hypothetical protein
VDIQLMLDYYDGYILIRLFYPQRKWEVFKPTEENENSLEGYDVLSDEMDTENN